MLQREAVSYFFHEPLLLKQVCAPSIDDSQQIYLNKRLPAEEILNV